MTSITAQVPLNLGLKDSMVFAGFIAGANGEALDYLQRCFGREPSGRQPSLYLWGAAGAGKSHLLQALCHAAGERGEAAVYLPLRRAAEFPFEALDGLEAMTVICLDDIDAVAGQPEWEQALLRLFVRVHDSGCAVAATASVPVGELGLQLDQLTSRLVWGMSFQLRALTVAERQQALSVRARRRGLELGEDAMRYLVRRYGDDNHALFAALEHLDQASMISKRRLTVPFIRSVLPPDSTADREH